MQRRFIFVSRFFLPQDFNVDVMSPPVGREADPRAGSA